MKIFMFMSFFLYLIGDIHCTPRVLLPRFLVGWWGDFHNMFGGMAITISGYEHLKAVICILWKSPRLPPKITIPHPTPFTTNIGNSPLIFERKQLPPRIRPFENGQIRPKSRGSLHYGWGTPPLKNCLPQPPE